MSHVALGFVKIVLLISFHFPYFPCAFFSFLYPVYGVHTPSIYCVYIHSVQDEKYAPYTYILYACCNMRRQSICSE